MRLLTKLLTLLVLAAAPGLSTATSQAADVCWPQRPVVQYRPHQVDASHYYAPRPSTFRWGYFGAVPRKSIGTQSNYRRDRWQIEVRRGR